MTFHFHNECGSVGIGRRARLRILWQQCRVGSSPIFRIKFLRKSLDFQGFFCIILYFSILLKFLQSFFTIPFFITFLFHYFLLHRLSAQILYNLSGNDQSCHRRHKCHTARYIPTLRTLMFCSRWADTVRSAADRHIFYRSCRLFLGIDHL